VKSIGSGKQPAKRMSAGALAEQMSEQLAADALEKIQHQNNAADAATQTTAKADEPTADTLPAGESSPAADSQETPMSQINNPAAGAAPVANQPASMEELAAACPGAPSDFLVDQAKKKATANDATRAYVQFQNAQIRARDEELKQVKEKAEQRMPGVQTPVKSNITRKPASEGSGGGDALSEFNEVVREEMKMGKGRKDAIDAVRRRNPELHQAYVDAINSK